MGGRYEFTPGKVSEACTATGVTESALALLTALTGGLALCWPFAVLRGVIDFSLYTNAVINWYCPTRSAPLTGSVSVVYMYPGPYRQAAAYQQNR